MNDFFLLESPYAPMGDQIQAIETICSNINSGVNNQVLLGVTGSGKTFTVANVISKLNRPALILAPNKTLAAQLYSEFKQLFPHNAVEYFVSYYDYYQPEAYLPHSDTYIEKDSSINEDIDKLRHSATHALLTRRDTLIIASVSCIYGLGSPEYYAKMTIDVAIGQKIILEQLIEQLLEIHYQRNDIDFCRGNFRIRGDALELVPSYSDKIALRIEFFGDEIEALYETDVLTGQIIRTMSKTVIYPGSHYVSDKENTKRATKDIRHELQVQLKYFLDNNKLVEAQRLEQKTMLDLEMIEEIGYCNGIENYSKHLDGRKKGQPPYTLIDYFPKDFLLFVDESHIAIPQVRGMFNGDQSRKSTLVNFGFRLPSALDNRPLNFDEFLSRMPTTVYVSATPGDWEMEHSQGIIAEQIIRPTGLLDPKVEVRPSKGQIDNLMEECLACKARDERVLVTTLTKRMAEDLSEFLQSRGMPCRYLHSDIDTLERIAIIEALRKGEFYILIGINLLREGLDIPETTLVAIFDADKEGFLRSHRSLIQTFGRAARNSSGRVILYADTITRSMRAAMDETSRRRIVQEKYNLEHMITPTTIIKSYKNVLQDINDNKISLKAAETEPIYGIPKDIEKRDKAIKKMELAMRKAVKKMEFELAAEIRDKIAIFRNYENHE